MPLAEAPQLGTSSDRQVRILRARRDDSVRREAVNKARRYIYKDHYAVGASVVEEVLKPNSLVAANVCLCELVSSVGFD